MRIGRWSLLLLVPVFTSCFGIDRRGGIIRYAKGIAHTGREQFSPGQLPPSWKGPKIRLKQLVHENDAIQATIVTDALCGPKFSDNPLPRLARDLFERLDRRKIEKGSLITVAGREAYRVGGSGSLDGIPLRMEVIVLKKHHCLFDLVYFAPPETFQQGVADFERYVDGLQFR